MIRCLKILIFLLSVLAMLTACAHVKPSSPDSEEAFRQRVEKRWEAQLQKDWGLLYDMTTESFKKEIDRQSFIQRSNHYTEKYAIKSVEILESGKKAQAIVDFTINQAGFQFNMTAKER